MNGCTKNKAAPLLWLYKAARAAKKQAAKTRLHQALGCSRFVPREDTKKCPPPKGRACFPWYLLSKQGLFSFRPFQPESLLFDLHHFVGSLVEPLPLGSHRGVGECLVM